MADEDKPPETERAIVSHKEKLEVARLEAETTQKTVMAVGEALKMVAESPGVKALFENAGKAFVLRHQLETVRVEKAHLEAMQAQQLNAQAASRRDKIGLVVLGGGLVVVIVAVVGTAVLVTRGVLDKGTALSIVGSLFTLTIGAIVGRRVSAPQRPAPGPPPPTHSGL